MRPMKTRLYYAFAHGIIAAAFIMGAFALSQLFDGGGLWVTSLGASAFIAAVFPAANSAASKILIGGYAIGSLFGVLCCQARLWLEARPHSPTASALIFCTVAVFLTVMAMSASGLGHPPSVALSIAITISDRPFVMALCAMGCICLLCLFKVKVILPAIRQHEQRRAGRD